jgi:hypothetical protein
LPDPAGADVLTDRFGIKVADTGEHSALEARVDEVLL